MALEASAEERETRGFISMTMTRPSSGLTANWMLQPPVSTPTSRMIAMPMSRRLWYSRSVSVIAGRDGDRVAGVHAHRVEVLDGADDHDVVVLVAHQLQLVLLPAEDGLLQEHLGGRREREALAGDAAQLLLVVGEAGAGAAHGEGGPDDDGVAAERVDARDDVVHGVADDRAGGLAVADLRADGLDDALEEVAVLALVDRLDVGADQLDAVLLQRHRSRACEIAVLSAVWPPRVGSSASGRSLAMIFSTNSGVIGST